MLANFLILSDTLLFKYFSLDVYFKENLDSGNKSSNMTSWCRRITSLCQSSYAQKLEIMSTLFCVVLMAVAWAVLKLKRGASESNPHPPHPVAGSEKNPLWVIGQYSMWSFFRPAPGPAGFTLWYNFREEKNKITLQTSFSQCLLISRFEVFLMLMKRWKIKLTRTFP